MSSSYPGGGSPVNGQSASPAARPQRAVSPARSTATFEAYFWEAYNEIVRPNRFDWYLVTKWLPNLGPAGFAIVKALRTLCYHNPRDGILRDTCEISMDDLAAMVGMKRTTLYEELKRNEALAQFVQRQEQIDWKGNRPVRSMPRFRVCMDDPIHTSDMEAYDQLRAQKERDRAPGEERRYNVLPKSGSGISDEVPKSENRISDLPKSGSRTPKSENRTRKSGSGILINKGSDLPSGSYIPTESLPALPETESPSHKCDPPGGEAEALDPRPDAPHPSDPLSAAWQQALPILAGLVNKPTYEVHLQPLHPVRIEQHGGDGETAVLAAPSAFSREWVAQRWSGHLAEALSAALGRIVTVKLIEGAK